MVKRILETAGVAAALLLAPRLAGAIEDFQYRSRADLRWVETDHWLVNTWGEVRFTDDAGKFTNWRVSGQAQYTPRRMFTFGVGYTFIRQDGFDVLKNRDTDLATHRLELDATPHFDLSEHTRFNLRARFENRWIEGSSAWNPQARFRPELVFTVHGCGPLAEVFTSDEIFYDLKADRLAENRFIPAGITLALGHQTRLRLYYLLDSIHTATDWSQLHVLQTQLIFNLR